MESAAVHNIRQINTDVIGRASQFEVDSSVGYFIGFVRWMYRGLKGKEESIEFIERVSMAIGPTS
jgi:hypothetical protein